MLGDWIQNHLGLEVLRQDDKFWELADMRVDGKLSELERVATVHTFRDFEVVRMLSFYEPGVGVPGLRFGDNPAFYRRVNLIVMMFIKGSETPVLDRRAS